MRTVICRNPACGKTFPTRAQLGNPTRCPRCRHPQRTGAAGAGEVHPAAVTVPALPDAQEAGQPCPGCGAGLLVSPRSTTWFCPGCGGLCPPRGVLAPYQRAGQPRQARSAGERLDDAIALARHQDQMLAGLDALHADGRLGEGSQLGRLLRKEITDAQSDGQLEEIARTLMQLSLPRARPRGPQVIPGEVVIDEEDATVDRAAARERRRAQLAELQADAARKFGVLAIRPGYFTRSQDGPQSLPPGLGDGHVPGLARQCQKCRSAAASVLADTTGPAPGTVSIAGGTLPARLCRACAQFVQQAAPGTWQITPFPAEVPA